jgi:hypothetical protein
MYLSIKTLGSIAALFLSPALLGGCAAEHADSSESDVKAKQVDYAWAECDGGEDGSAGQIALVTEKDAKGLPVVVGIKGRIVGMADGKLSSASFNLAVERGSPAEREKTDDSTHFQVQSPVLAVRSDGVKFRTPQIVTAFSEPAFGGKQKERSFVSAKLTQPDRSDRFFSVDYNVEGEHTHTAHMVVSGCKYKNARLLSTIKSFKPGSGGGAPPVPASSAAAP